MIELKFGKLFQEVREKRGLNYKNIAEKAGIDRMTLHRLKEAKSADDFNATLKLVDRICLSLGVDLNKVIKFKKK